MGVVEQYLLQLKIKKRRLRRTAVVLTALSLLVATGVSWNLRMTGVALANDACCGYEEHQHTDECLVQNIVCGYDVEPAAEIDEDMAFAPYEFDPILDSNSEGEPLHIHVDACYQTEYRCGHEEHLHSLACYSDPTADVETPLDWQEMFEDYPYTGNLCEDLVGIAKTQVGYAESALNFEADNDEVKHGYTRYGAWYGAPYNEWSAMFVSFCLHYAGADLSEYPINSGANTMAALWDAQGRYTQAGAYFPAAGDLVFFEDNTVGIVAEVQSATMYVISGDVEDAVSGELLPLNDASIVGWGITGDPLSEDIPTFEEHVDELHKEDLSDRTDSPALDGDRMPSFLMSSGDTREIKNLLEYLQSPENPDERGSIIFTLLDKDGKEVPKDDNKNYIVDPDTEYELAMTINSPNGFHPGTYEYQLPAGITTKADNGDFVLDKTGINIGSWEVSDAGELTFVFNTAANTHSKVAITVTLDVNFSEQNDPIDFDGSITVTVKKPPESEEPTKLNKWGYQGAEKDNEDPTKIYWTLEITGQKDSRIPGSIITDQVMQGEYLGTHTYTESDRAKGLWFEAGSGYDPVTGNYAFWHRWYVAPDDPDLQWTETGWTYKMPETVDCEWCSDPLTLGNDGWIYYIKYTSTPEFSGVAGKLPYSNAVTMENQQVTGWSEFTHGELEAGIVKNGVFHGDADGGKFLWEFQATVPGRPQGQRAAYYTQIRDHLRVKDSVGSTIAYIANDADKATVTAVYNGQTITVPHVQDAAATDPFAWAVGWSEQENGIAYTHALLLLCRCRCTAETCHYWGGTRCGADYWLSGYPSGYCFCWTEEQNTTFTFSYETNDPTILETYGNQGMKLQNEAVLEQQIYQPDGSRKNIILGDDKAEVPVPGVFKKELTKDYKDYEAHYRITVNEAKLTLTDGSPLTIHDVMTETLAYISGSLVITAEDANGNRTILQQNTDFTVTYDGTGSQTDSTGNKVHVLDIVILKPQPVMYILDYDTTLIIPQEITGAIKYSNAASITLWGKTITDDTGENIHTDINIAAEQYTVEMHKTCAETGDSLAGATFGLYNAQGGLITDGVTDADGKLRFQTNVIEGIILRDHELYYLQEIQPPPTYQLDDTKYWLCFCSGTGDTCSECSNLLADTEAVRIPFETIGLINIANYPFRVELPATGGIGTPIYVLCGLVLTSAPLVYGLSLRRKYERRSRE